MKMFRFFNLFWVSNWKMCCFFNNRKVILFECNFDHTVAAAHLFTLGHAVVAPVSLRPPYPKAQYALIGQLSRV